MPGGWERLASHEGGTIFALTTAPADEANGALVFAATAAGLFSSGDGGRGWSPGGDMPLPLVAAVAPSVRFVENRTIFAGTGTGFYRSNDAGRTWRQTLSEGHILAIATVPGAGPGERLFIGTEEDGILRSDDGGETWAGANPGLLDLTVLALAFSPDAARDQVGFAATASGLYRTRNGGKSWREVALPLDEPEVQCLAISPTFAADRLVLAGTAGEGLWRSDDGGTNWDLVPGLPAGGIGALAFSPRYAESRLVAVATAGGVALSRDGGETWHLTGQALPPVLSLAFVSAAGGESLLAGLHRAGAARLDTTAGDDEWTPASAGLGATLLLQLVASPTFARDQALFAAGAEAGLRVSRDGGRTWTDAGTGLPEAAVHGVAVAPDASGRCLLVVATDAGIYRRRDDGAGWEAPTSGGQSPARIVVAGVAAANGPVPVFAATFDGRLLASDDGGADWRPLDAAFDGATVISLALSPDYARDRTLYAGTTRPAPADAGQVTLWRSTDGGARWVRWLEERGAEGLLPLAVPATSGDDVLFVGLPGRVAQPRRNTWQTRGGARYPLWSGAALLTGGNLATVTALAASPNYRADGLVFAATSAGVFRSRTRGRTFERWSKGLVPTPVLALATAAGDEGVLVFALGVDGTIWRRAGGE